MKNNRNYDELLNSGIKAQKEKLEANSHKRGFDKLSIEYAFGRLQDEFLELFEEMYEKKQRNLSNIRKEAADVANFAHMIILACDKGIGK
jgi:NTP pyrophosphatase (non-canonical NTP hydrolase)